MPTLPADPLARIAALIMAKRRETGLGVRAAAKAADVNAATLSRLERQMTPNLPDSATLKKLAAWLGVTFEYLLAIESPRLGGSPTPSLPEVIEVHLRADHKLTPEKAETLAKMFKMLYQNVTNGTLE